MSFASWSCGHEKTGQYTHRGSVWTSLIWSVILGIFNVYHVITAIIYEASNISEILILVLLVFFLLILVLLHKGRGCLP